MKPQAVQQDATYQGRWRIYAKAPGYEPVEITFVREVPITIGDWGFGDPFGPTTCTLTFPQVTVLDRVGDGDLFWMSEGVNVNIEWDGTLPAGYPDGAFAWEGYMTSFDYSTTGLSVALKGAMQQLDNYLAKPGYLSRPIPYETALQRQWDDRPDLRLSELVIEWPSWWSTVYTPVRGVPPYNVPSGVRPGAMWTGLVTRQTGSWEPTLTNYMQTLLASMYTDQGRWTIDLRPNRRPVLRHRDFQHEVTSSTLIIDPASPGVEVSLSQDASQSLNVVYGQGTALTGEAFTGMEVSADGSETTYAPLAALRQVHPVTDRNGWLQPSRMRKEVLLQVQQGLDLEAARKVGEGHLAHFTDPGLTGTITLSTDPSWGTSGAYLPRALIKAGMSAQLKGALGRPEGLMLHIVSVSTSLMSGKTTLTVDSKYRDQLTVDEVRLRGRDALSISRLLIAGQYQPPVPDQLVPWNYNQGSGYIPSGPQYSSVPLFRDMPREYGFPWEEWTTQRPPRSKSWQNCYIHIPAASANADNNWARVTRQKGGQFGFPIKMAQAGSIRLLQVAAYDLNGNVLKVPFHIGFYQAFSISPQSMPMVPASYITAYNAAVDARNAATNPIGTEPHTTLVAGQHYPFFDGAWETYNLDGTQKTTEQTTQVSSSGMIRAWGTGSVPAGYWPGTKTTGDPATGLLVDEATWEFNLGSFDKVSSIDPYNVNQKSQSVGYVYAMIYCDAQLAQDVYFAGRMFRVEPGSTV